MEQLTFTCKVRKEMGTRASRRLRRADEVPAVLYGHKEEPVHVSVSREDLERGLATGARMAQLDLEGKREPALIKNVQHDAFGKSIIHVDFARVGMDERVELSIPIEISGTAKGTKDGGIVDLVHKEIEVSCLATNIPDRIMVRVTDLDIGDHVLVKDLVLPEGVTATEDPESPVVVVHPPAVEVAPVEAELEGEAPTEPEVIGKGKEEEEPES